MNQFDNAFYNNDNNELDNMARQLNDKKKKLYTQVKNDYKNQEKETLKGIDAIYSDNSGNFAPSYSDYSLDNYKSDFDSGLPTPLSEVSSINYDSEISSEYSSLPKKSKKHLRLHTQHLQRFNEKDDKMILEHIKNCDECKYQLLHLLKTENHIFPKKEQENILGMNYTELKDLLILIIIGSIIIVLLDIFIREII